MLAASRLEDVAARLQEYQQQILALNQALDSLKSVGDLINAALAEERNTLIGIAVQLRDAESSADVMSETSQADVMAVETAVDEAPAECQQVEALKAVAALAETFKTKENENDVLFSTTSVAEPATSFAPNEGVADTSSLELGADGAAQLATVAEMEKVDTASGDFVVEPALVSVEPPGDETTNVVPLVERRPKPVSSWPSRRRGIGYAAGMVLMGLAGTAGVQGLADTELMQRIIELGSCDGDALAANRDCALLAWMLL